MKKFMKSLVAMVLLFCVLLSTTGCISKNWSKVERKLEKKGYEVECLTNEEYIEEALEELYINAEYKAVDPAEVDCLMFAYKGSKTIIIAFCKDRATAKKMEAKAEDLLVEFADLMDMDKDDCKVGRDGKVAYIGHKDAVRAAK